MKKGPISPSQLSLEIADRMAPRDPRYQGRHYRSFLSDAHIVIERFRMRIAELEAELDKVKRDSAYNLSLCVTRTAAEEARQAAFRLARGKAAALAEDRDGSTNPMSYAIECIPDPKPKFTI